MQHFSCKTNKVKVCPTVGTFIHLLSVKMLLVYADLSNFRKEYLREELWSVLGSTSCSQQAQCSKG